MNTPDGPVMADNRNPRAEPATHRIGQACLICRRKKVKCDGKTPACHNCQSRNFTCEYPTSNDNASASRHYAKAFEERCQQLDQFCHRLESISTQLSQSIASISHLNLNGGSSLAGDDELQRAAQLLHSMPAGGQSTQAVLKLDPNRTRVEDGSSVTNGVEEEDESESDEDEDDIFREDGELAEPGQFGSLVSDSYGRLRYLGGANNVLVEAAKGLSPGTNSSPSSSILNTVAAAQANGGSLELPIFVQGNHWPENPYMPTPSSLPRPPQFTADMLVNTYFEHLHYTFPVLYRPHFMAQYKKLTMASSQNTPVDNKFLSVFFAVCACASGLLPQEGKDTAWSGLPYYQRALVLHTATTGEASIERVQCLALFAMCSGGWNTLTQSWTWASQAVRAAQDLGMHLSGLMEASDEPSKLIKQQLCRRIWWTVYCLDRVTSICLGRPMAADDMDSLCVPPLSLSDADLNAHSIASTASPTTARSIPPSPMTGFLAFADLAKIAGRIQRLHAPSRVRALQSSPKHRDRFFRSVSSLQKALDRWLENLPREIRQNANSMDRGPHLTMCVIMFIGHAGSLLNLYRLLSGTASQETLGQYGDQAVGYCVEAARSCINAAELIREIVPPSHYLAFCVHYLTLSGLVLLRMPPPLRQEALPDVRRCINFLKGLEMTWSGASKGRAIIEHLLETSAEKEVVDRNGVLGGAGGGMEEFWPQMPGSELFVYEAFGTEFLNLQ